MGAEERHALFIVALLLTLRKTPEDIDRAAGHVGIAYA